MLRSSTISFYQADGLGSDHVTEQRVLGALAQTYTFDSFGNQTASSAVHWHGSWFPLQNGSANSTPRPNSILIRARYFDPSTGRFLSEIQSGLRGGNNFYTYVLDRRPFHSRRPAGIMTSRRSADQGGMQEVHSGPH